MKNFHFALPLLALLVAGCADKGPDEAIGDLVVTTHLVSGTADPDGYTLTLTGHADQPIGVTDTVRFYSLPINDYTVGLTGVAAGCTVAGGASQSIYVPVGVKNFQFDVTCP